MTGHSEAQQWREWLCSVVGSLGRLDGESGLEFCESGAMELGDEIREHPAETQTVAELLVAEVVAEFQKASAEAYLDKQRPLSRLNSSSGLGWTVFFASPEIGSTEVLDLAPRKPLVGGHSSRSRSKHPTLEWRNRRRDQGARIRSTWISMT